MEAYLKEVYAFDPINHDYDGKRTVMKDDFGAWNIPSNCTEIAPPSATDIEVPVWNPDTKEWALVPDYRPYLDEKGNSVVRKKLWKKDAKYGDQHAHITELGDYDHSLYTELEPVEPSEYERFIESLNHYSTDKDKTGYSFSYLRYRLGDRCFSDIPVVDIDGKAYTVDEANHKYLEQVGDDDAKATLIKTRWKEAKDYIRSIDWTRL